LALIEQPVSRPTHLLAKPDLGRTHGFASAAQGTTMQVPG